MADPITIVTAIIAVSAITSLASTISAFFKKSKEKPNKVTIKIGDKEIEISKDNADKILEAVQKEEKAHHDGKAPESS